MIPLVSEGYVHQIVCHPPGVRIVAVYKAER